MTIPLHFFVLFFDFSRKSPKWKWKFVIIIKILSVF